MKTRIQKILRKEDEEVIIQCVELSPIIREIYSYSLAKGQEIIGCLEGTLCKIRLEDICYFEAVDEKLFACTSDHIYDVKMRLYEVESTYKYCHFIRCSKSVVLNLMQLEGISPTLNGRFYAHMKNKEKVVISRQYVKEIRRVMTNED